MTSVSLLYGTRLTRREIQIRSLIIDGLSSGQIAEQLSISKYTVANHRKNILKKKGVKSIKTLLR